MFWFSVQILTEPYLNIRRNERDIIKMRIGRHLKYPLFLSDFNENCIFSEIFEKAHSWKLYFLRDFRKSSFLKIVFYQRFSKKLILENCIFSEIFEKAHSWKLYFLRDFRKSSFLKIVLSQRFSKKLILENPSRGSQFIPLRRTDRQTDRQTWRS